jgi:hypothetical protein
VILGPAATEEIMKLLLPNSAAGGRIMEMHEDIKYDVKEKLHIAEKFSLQLDETTDASGKSQLISSARFVVETQIIQQLSFCQELDTTITTGNDMMTTNT